MPYSCFLSLCGFTDFFHRFEQFGFIGNVNQTCRGKVAVKLTAFFSENICFSIFNKDKPSLFCGAEECIFNIIVYQTIG